MKKLLLIISATLLFNSNVNAQCSTGCTYVVTGLTTSSYYLLAGQKLCIASTGTLTGRVAVSGGTICNQGKIQTTAVLVANGGVFDNYGVSVIDTLYVTQGNAKFTNYGNMTNVVMGTAASATSINNGTMLATLLGDSIGTFINNGNLTINNDLYNTYSSSFTNNGYMSIGRDFLNATSSSFSTKCMINVSRDWYNSASVTGATTGCGGFNVTNNTYNTGTMGSLSSHLDICDANNPGTINANTGTIAGTTTYCSCASSACMVVGINEHTKEAVVGLFPNPTSGLITLQSEETIKTIVVTNQLGQVVLTNQNVNQTTAQLDLHALVKGVYLISLTTASGANAYKKVIKE